MPDLLRRCTFLLGILIFMMECTLISCSTSTPTTSIDALATAVSATLTAYPTATPPPTASPIPKPTQVLPPTPTASDTATPGPSPTATAPPLPSGDPRNGLNLSSPDYKDEFNISTTWGGPNSEAALNLIRDGHLEAVDYLTDSYVWWSTTVPEGRDIYAQINATFSSCSGKDSAGLGLRIGGAQYDSGYALEVSCDGHYRVRKFSSGVIETLIDWTFSSEIVQGPEMSNDIGFVARDNGLHVAINNTIVGSAEDFSYYSGTFALFANALETPGLTIIFDDFKLWYF